MLAEIARFRFDTRSSLEKYTGKISKNKSQAATTKSPDFPVLSCGIYTCLNMPAPACPCADHIQHTRAYTPKPSPLYLHILILRVRAVCSHTGLQGLAWDPVTMEVVMKVMPHPVSPYRAPTCLLIESWMMCLSPCLWLRKQITWEILRHHIFLKNYFDLHINNDWAFP